MKAVIPAAGYGTRFLPQTKAMPKEMLPVVDKPVIQYVVEEIISSGISDIVIVSNHTKRSIEDHFSETNQNLVHNLELGKKYELINETEYITKMANFSYVRQQGLHGTGGAILSAEHIIGNEYFIVIWGDEFVQSEIPRLRQMLNFYETCKSLVVSGISIDDQNLLSHLAVADLTYINNNISSIQRVHKKPSIGSMKNKLFVGGAYILPPEIFIALRSLSPDENGEISLSDAINIVIENGIPSYVIEIEGASYYNAGDKLGYLQTVFDFALKHHTLGPKLKDYLSKYFN